MTEYVDDKGEVIEAVETTAVVPVPQAGVQLGLLRADKPGEMVKAAADLATALADIISKRKLFSTIQGRDFVKVEGWTTLAVMLGVTPHEVSVAEAPEGCFTATVELRRLTDGAVVGRASAECGGPDDTIWAKRQRNARRSMALTRATGKACRLAFSWIMTLAGYEVTPAEEMDGVRDERPAKQEPPAGCITRQQVGTLNAIMESVRQVEPNVRENFLRGWDIPDVGHLPAEKYEKAHAQLNKRFQEKARQAGGVRP